MFKLNKKLLKLFRNLIYSAWHLVQSTFISVKRPPAIAIIILGVLKINSFTKKKHDQNYLFWSKVKLTFKLKHAH